MLSGRVILDKNSNIRTVVNKMGSIETEFRTFPMEVIAGIFKPESFYETPKRTIEAE